MPVIKNTKKELKTSKLEVEEEKIVTLSNLQLKAQEISILEERLKELKKQIKNSGKDLKEIYNNVFEGSLDETEGTLVPIDDNSAIISIEVPKRQTNSNTKVINALLKVLWENNFFDKKEDFIDQLSSVFGVSIESISIDEKGININRQKTFTKTPYVLTNKTSVLIDLINNEELLTTIPFDAYEIYGGGASSEIESLFFVNGSNRIAFKILKENKQNWTEVILPIINIEVIRKIRESKNDRTFFFEGIELQFNKKALKDIEPNNIINNVK